jgi:hypothetical protein
VTIDDLKKLGYQVTHHPDFWIDVGGPENGPKLSGHVAYDEWVLDDKYAIVVDNAIVEEGRFSPYEMEF